MDYILQIELTPLTSRVSVQHNQQLYTVLELDGSAARCLLESGVLATQYCRTGHYSCNKSMAWHLLLASVAVLKNKPSLQAETGNGQTSMNRQLSTPVSHCKIKRLTSDCLASKLGRALKHRRDNLTLEQMAVANVLINYQHSHLTRADVEILLLLKALNLESHVVGSVLQDFVSNNLIKLIRVTDSIEFYDVKTEPHAHVYCEHTDQLYDAEVDGCIYLRSGAADAKLSDTDSHSCGIHIRKKAVALANTIE